MADLVIDFLQTHGPARGAAITDVLEKAGVSSAAARKQLSRARIPVMRFEHALLPKGEGFYYLPYQYLSDLFWDNWLKAQRGSHSVYGIAIDGIIARGGLVPYNQFAVASGAPARPMKGQVDADTVRYKLVQAGLLENLFSGHDQPEFTRYKPMATFVDFRTTPELIMLDALREWAKRLGFGSFNKIAIRGDERLQSIGPFLFDLAGPSWFAPPGNAPGRQAFLVADVFAEGRLDENQIAYFLRKIAILKAMPKGPRLVPFLVAESFTGSAMTAAHAAGISLATPTFLFGKRVGAALVSLCETLKRAAAYAASDTPDRILGLVNDLSEIEGRNNNLRGILFELVAAYLARRGAVSVEMGTRAWASDGRSADIDILTVAAQASGSLCVECKGKEPGGVLGIDEVQAWLAKLPIIREFLANHKQLRAASHRFELWTSGTFSAEALALLEQEKINRTRMTIDWKDGKAVYDLAIIGKEKAIADSLRQHFIEHPLASITPVATVGSNLSFPVDTAKLLAQPGPAPYGGYSSLPGSADRENH